MSNYPTPIKKDSRICFGIHFFATEEEAKLASEIVQARGDTYNGGYYDGMKCGRDVGFDIRNEDGQVTHFAVTVA